jgi:hypothetical protein
MHDMPLLPAQFVLIHWDYGLEDNAAVDAALVAAVPNGAQQFTSCATASATEVEYFEVLRRLTDVGSRFKSFSFAIVWINGMVHNTIHQGRRP